MTDCAPPLKSSATDSSSLGLAKFLPIQSCLTELKVIEKPQLIKNTYQHGYVIILIPKIRKNSI